jgi:hypothetical protein
MCVFLGKTVKAALAPTITQYIEKPPALLSTSVSSCM